MCSTFDKGVKLKQRKNKPYKLIAVLLSAIVLALAGPIAASAATWTVNGSQSYPGVIYWNTARYHSLTTQSYYLFSIDTQGYGFCGGAWGIGIYNGSSSTGFAYFTGAGATKSIPGSVPQGNYMVKTTSYGQGCAAHTITFNGYLTQ